MPSPTHSRGGPNDSVSPTSAVALMHADLDAFYASVEAVLDPSLAGRPLIVGGGVVLAASYEVKRRGVDSGMNARRARELCPEAAWVTPNFDQYAEFSRQVMDIFRSFTPLVEPLSPDEAFLDVSGAKRLLGEPEEIGQALRAQVYAETGLRVSVGIARTKFLAKVASAACKPDGLLLVPQEEELSFLHPLPVRALWGVGPKTVERLRLKGIHRVGDLAELPEEVLSGLVGTGLGQHLHALGWNRDLRTVDPETSNKSIGAQQAVARIHDREQVDRLLLALAHRVGSRVRAADVVGRTVSIRIRWADDFHAVTRGRTLPVATQATDTIFEVARELMFGVLDEPAARDREVARQTSADRMSGAEHTIRSALQVRGISLIGLSVAHLAPADHVQLALPLGGSDQDIRAPRTDQDHAHLDAALDDIRRKYGRLAISPASLLDDGGRLAPLWPDLDKGP